jgi:hypothetical protein
MRHGRFAHRSDFALKLAPRKLHEPLDAPGGLGCRVAAAHDRSDALVAILSDRQAI